ncbi:hypothetical protein TGAM01_v201914 [Trichoderma gamsii]|uniref:Uncharacterized protein n=1 Tax=Trichoderma gamsii TaxID=398673 RepID=A0A2P4ZWZ8_9HYPO|nr:hypothetical protein TGAM01_v201914 [Trichoderma gamsii]PON28806.1 hypothetical protein TGAM01_v201914 [Trichoderma gamsii]
MALVPGPGVPWSTCRLWNRNDAEGRTFLHGVLCIDSLLLGNPEDSGLVVATGSHGGVIAAGMTSSFRPRLAFFNDAGFGADRAGVACLPILDSEGIAAATVAADSACIGDALEEPAVSKSVAPSPSPAQEARPSGECRQDDATPARPGHQTWSWRFHKHDFTNGHGYVF